MEQSRKYYEAYDDRYRQVHGENLQWFGKQPSGIVQEILEKYRLNKNAKILEIGCGEGRDAQYLLNLGYDVLGTDVSSAAVEFCKKADPVHADHYDRLDCLQESLDSRFDYIYSVAVAHMLVPDEDRDGFYRFYRNHLTQSGIGLICSMGDGVMQRRSDITGAFDTQQRLHEESGRMLTVANTSCRIVSAEEFEAEILRNGLQILEMGMTSVEPDFPFMIYAVVGK